jgi:DNA-binding transcriptional MerR regulator
MQKLYHSISEISEMLAEEQHILRYWEKEFPQLNPKKNRAGNRIYSDKDLFILMLIKKFLRNDKLSLKGAQEQLINYLNSTDSENYRNMIENFSTIQFPAKEEGFFPAHNTEQIRLDKRDAEQIMSLLKDISSFLRH